MNNIAVLVPYMPIDRRHALVHGRTMGDRTTGAALFADVSGFTALTGALMRELGPKRGAEEVLVYLNPVFDSLIGELHLYGGVVIGFAGDSITCWLEGDNGKRAVACALAMQEVMRPLETMHTEVGTPFSLHIKVAITVGPARRFTVGSPDIQMVDVLAGETLIRMAAAEGLASKGETVVEEGVLKRLGDSVTVDGWRENDNGFRVGVVSELLEEPIISPWPDLPVEKLDPNKVQSWLLRPVQERIQAGQGFLAELRPAVALFMRFTGIDYDRDDAAGEKMDNFIRWVQEVIGRTDGYLIQLTVGDKGSFLYVAYGAPIGHDDNAIRAVSAALEFQAKATSFAGIEQIQIGLSAGRMWTGAYGAAVRRTYGVMGNETNMAARLMGKAKPGQILVSRPVFEAAQKYYRMEDLGLIEVKGSKDPIPVWEVLDRRRGASSEWAQFDRPFVGRQKTRQQLASILDEVLEDHGHVVQLVGDAGMGKSHLAAQFGQEALDQNVLLAVAACQSITRGSAYFAWRQIFRNLLNLEVQDEVGAIAQLTNFIEHEHPQWLIRLPLLGDLLALPIPDNPTMAALDAATRQSSLISLVVEMLQMWLGQRPLLVVIENAHWMDESSRTLTEAVAQQLLGENPGLLLLIHRPLTNGENGSLDGLKDQSHHVQITLAEMPDEEIGELIRLRLGDSSDNLAVSIIKEMARGSPFFAGELVDALCQSGQLEKDEDGAWHVSEGMLNILRSADFLLREEGAWVLKPGVDLSTVKLGIPDSIHNIVLERLDRLPEAHKLTLKVGSVIGHQFELPLVGRAHPETKELALLRSEAEYIAAAEILIQDNSLPDLYAFRHHSTQEVAYETLLYTQRRQLHGSVAQAMSEIQPQISTQIAFHAFLGQKWLLSLKHNLISGEQAKRLYANQQSIDFFEKALQSAEALSENDTLEQRKAIHLALGELLVTIGQYEPADNHLRAAFELAQSTEDREAEGRACRWMGRAFELQSDFETALAWFDEGLSTLEGLDSAEEAEIHILAGLIHSRQGNYEQTIQLAERSLRLADKLDDDMVRARAFNLLGIVALRHGETKEAVNRFQKSLGYHERLEDLYGQATCHNLIANGYFPQGEWTKADYHYRRSLQLFTQIGSIYNQVFVNNNVGGIALKQGRLDDALGHYRRAVDLLEQIGGSLWVLGALHMNIGSTLIRSRDFEAAGRELKVAQDYFDQTQLRDLMPELYGLFAELSLVKGELDEADSHGRHSLELAREMEFALEEGHNLRIMGEISLACSDLNTAQNYLENSLSILQEAGDQYESAKTQLTLAQLFISLGQQERASSSLDTSLKAFEQLDAQMDLQHARELQKAIKAG